MPNNKKNKLSPAEQRRLDKEVRKLASDALYKELKKVRGLPVRQTPNKDLEITIEL